MGGLKKSFLDGKLATLLKTPDSFDIKAPISTQPQSFGTDETNTKPLPFLGEKLDLTANLNAKVFFGEPGPINIFESNQNNVGEAGDPEAFIQLPEPVQPPAGTLFNGLEIDADVSVQGEASIPSGSLNFGISAGAQAGFRYQWLQALASDTSYGDAAESLAKTTILPDWLNLKDFPENCLAAVQTHFGFNLQAKVSSDAQKVISGNYFNNVNAAYEVKLDAGLAASAGAAFFEDMWFSVDRLTGNNQEQGWVRVRLRRLKQSSLNFSAAFSLGVQYQLGSGLIVILDDVLDNSPWPKVKVQLEKVGSLSKQVADGDWQTIIDDLKTAGADEIFKLLKIDDLLNSQDAQKIFGEFVDTANQFLNAYNQIDPELQSLWDRFLGYANLHPDSPIRQALAKLASLQGMSLEEIIESLLPEEANEVADLINAMTGLSLEEITTGGDTADIEAAIQKAAAAAQSAQNFLNTAPQQAFDYVQNYANQFGITKVVGLLQKNATSIQSLKDYIKKEAATFVQNTVAKILDKAVSKLNNDDIKKIREFAGKLSKDLGRLANIDSDIRNLLQKLNGEAGLNLSLALNKTKRGGTFLDIELDPSNSDNRKAFARLITKGDLAGFFKKLPEPSDDPAQDDPLPYFINESVFFSRTVRSTMLSFVFSLFGGQSSQTKRICESREVMRQKGNQVSRTGTFSGGLILGRTKPTGSSGTYSWQSSVFFEAQAKGTDQNFSGPFHGESLRQTARLTTTRDDSNTTYAEWEALRQQLLWLGFFQNNPEAAAAWQGYDFPSNVVSRLTITLTLGTQNEGQDDEPGPSKNPVAFFLHNDPNSDHNQANWAQDYLNAAHAWLNTPLEGSPFPGRPSLPLGPVLAAVINTTTYQKAWNDGPSDMVINQIKRLQVAFGSERVNIFLNNLNFLQIIAGLGINFGQGMQHMAKAVKQQGLVTGGDPDRATLTNWAGSVAQAIQKTTPSKWDNPLFFWWFVLARLTRGNPSLLANAKGLAQVQYQNSDGTWHTPLNIQLKNGLKHNILGLMPVFPLTEPPETN